ncbi:DUF4433 domain-containing protein [Hahella sp. KA22]|uniref:type II toxin-antitoxin system toxin DNA ADP-ribosyl transferase DarT n=1 Tax=Hahella sp. KA22 TaxID=1628392 RepID=UPI000FDD4D14|nr:DUF4433 domain-containing protein [Hahella sp. KA22]AZZ92435.1 DUF4433 domain-containing protein [Hahella sp. KA22]QAY55809.1 DUF4433 domain-containing protein [Hahella sp. KA22]
MIYTSLNPQKALIWRIVHRENVPWILDHGLHCGNSPVSSSNWVSIGNPELTDKRATHAVPVGPKGYLNDYVPFYFTPFSPMMKNIHSGWGGIKQRPNEEIVILVSDLYRVSEMGLPFVFTNGHAYYAWTDFFTDLDDLENIDWTIIQSRDFKRDPNDPAKFERYQAEALIHQSCPVDALKGMVCYTENTKKRLDGWLHERQMAMPVHARPRWYF